MKQVPVKKDDGSIAVGFAAGILVLFLLGVFTGRDIRYMGAGRAAQPDQAQSPADGSVDEGKVPQTGTDSATIKVSTQAAGMEVHVGSVTLHTAGWVVVHEIDGGHVLNALGARRLNVGTHADVAVELLRATDPGHEYAIVLYTDNGNKVFEIRGDLPMIDAKGEPLMQTFRTFGGGAGGQ